MEALKCDSVVPAESEGYSLSLDGTLITLPKSDVIYLLKLAIPDMTFLGADSNSAIKYSKLLEEIQDED